MNKVNIQSQPIPAGTKGCGDQRNKYLIDSSTINIIKHSKIRPDDIKKTNIKISRATIYRWFKGGYILYNNAIRLAEFYGYEPIFKDDIFIFGDKLKNEHEESIKILEEQIGREKELFMKVQDLENQLAEEEMCYASAISRANRAETKLKIIKETLDL